jgi:hypothetical protein
MGTKLTNADTAILGFIAQYKLLTVKQLSVLTERSVQVLRRRLRFFKSEQLVRSKEHGFGRGPGRREDIIMLTEAGLKLLKSERFLAGNRAYLADKMSDSIFAEHDLLRNWFFVHLIEIQKQNPRFAVQVVTNCFNISDKNIRSPSAVGGTATANESKHGSILIPDGAFSITDRNSGKALLFFLEVDMGTEPLANTTRTPGDIRHKIISYQRIFQTKRYKRYEKVFNSSFNGFCLLFLAGEIGRMKSICDLVQQIPHSEFIWITDQQKMFAHGIGAEIWSKNGQYENHPQSILGPRLAFEAPVNDRIL